MAAGGGLSAVLALDTCLAAGPGEAPWLRWVRVAAEHPERVGLAFLLLHRALRRSRRKNWTESAGTPFEDRANSL